MRNLIFILNLLIICGCNSDLDTKTVVKESSANETKNIICDQNYDSLLIAYANGFVPTSIGLNNSLSPDITSFLLSVDTNCLRKQKEYKYFVSLILAKSSLHHLKCCNQHYDLYQMREGAASVIINEFNRLAGYKGQSLEMLNSGLITDYVKNDKILSENLAITEVLNAIKKEEDRIKQGVF